MGRASHVNPRRDPERGAGSVEYVGIIIAVAVLVVALLAVFPSVGSSLAGRVEEAVCEITGGTGCGSGDRTASGEDSSEGRAGTEPGREDSRAEGSEPREEAEPDGSDERRDAGDSRRDEGRTDTRPGDGRDDVQAEGAEPGSGGSDKSREDEGRDARDSRRDDVRRGEPTKGPDPSSPGSSTAVGLGDPVPGESVPKPEPPAREPVDEGAGEYSSDGNGFFERLGKGDDLAVKAAAEAGAHALSGTWPNASRNLLHYLGNSGEPLKQDVDQMLTDVPQLNDAYTTYQDDLGVRAVSRAKELGVTGPTTFPVSTDWRGFYIDKGMSADWFYATGGIEYSVVGEVTVYPPSSPGGEWVYETTTSMVYRDQYNWDGTKATQIGPLTVTDEQLARLHRAGVAQEYTLTGESATTTRKGP